MKLDYIIPCYRSEKTIKMVIDEITDVMNQCRDVDYDIIAINDCSPDNVLKVLEDISSVNSRVKVIDFMQNFGKDSAILAGLAKACGDIAVILDDDYQCPTYAVWDLVAPILSGDYDVTTADYEIKMESGLKRAGSELYRVCAQSMLGMPSGIRTENFYAISRKVYLEMLKYKNPYPFLDGLILRVTKRITTVPMKERNRGDDNTTGFTLVKSIKMIVDGLTAFSIKPLRVATFIGGLTAILGLVYMIFTIAFYFISDNYVTEGYSSLMSVILFIGGMMMMMIGMLGEYIGRIYICLNQSPQYVIRKTINLEEE